MWWYCRVIRRTIIRSEVIPPESTPVANTGPVEPVEGAASGAATNVGRNRPGPWALGRGLAGILHSPALDRSTNDKQQYGLDQLIGSEPAARSTELRSFVVDTALAVVADAFELDGLVVAGGAGSPSSRFLATRLPPSWSAGSPVLFELYGRLHAALVPDGPDQRSEFRGRPHPSPDGPGLRNQGASTWQASIGSHRAWLVRIERADHPVVAAAVRRAPFSPPESQALATVLGSLASALSGDRSDVERRAVLRSSLSVSVDRNESGATAIVGLTGPEGQRSASAVGPDVVTAVARAAADVCQPPRHVRFAGASAVDDHAVTIVIVGDGEGRLGLGFAVGPGDDAAGAAEAVLTAAR